MGVSVRVSRHVRIYMPFWVAIPLYAVVGAAWAVIFICIALWWLLVILPARGISAWQESRATRERAPSLPPAGGSMTAAQPIWAPPQDTPGRAQGQARIAEQFLAEESRNSRSEQWQAPLATRHARQQAEAPERVAADRARDAARRERRAAFRAARGPWSWPEWTLIVAVAAFVAVVILAAVAGPHPSSAINAAGAWLLGISILGGLVGVPTVAWRWYRARQAAAAMLAGQSQDSSPGPRP